MDDLIPATMDATADSGGVPLDLASLLSPYVHHPSLSIRVGRLPLQARLSRGHNNGDRTWSLTLDELDGLAYLPPDNAQESPTLEVRVISLDSDGAATLAQFDLPIASAVAPPAASPGPAVEPGNPAGQSVGAGATAQAAEPQEQLGGLAGELTKAQDDAAAAEALKAREIAELQDRHALALQAQAADTEARLAGELERRLREARAQWEVELEDRVASAVREAAQQAATEAKARLEMARQGWQKGSKRDLAAAKARVERAEAALAEARAQTAVSPQPRDDAALRRLHDALMETKATLAAREAELADARIQIDLARQQGSKNAIESELAAARAGWQAEMEKRLSAAAAQAAATLEQNRAAWQAEVEKRLSAAAAQAAATLEQNRAAWQAEMEKRLSAAAAQAAVTLEQSRVAWQAEHEARLAGSEERAQQLLAQARQSWQQEAATALARAEGGWQADEARRLGEVEARWREQSTQALAEATARFEQVQAALAETRAQAEAQHVAAAGELRALQEQVAKLEAAAVEREGELAQARAAIEQARERSVEEMRAALAKAEEIWKAEEARHVAEAEQRSWEQSRAALEEAKARYVQAEHAAGEARARAAVQHDTDDDEVRAVRERLAAAQVALADREAELALTREAIEKAREEAKAEAGEALAKAEKEWQLAEARRLAVARKEWEKGARIASARGAVARVVSGQRYARFGRRLIRGLVLAGCLAAAIVFYPRVEPIVVDRWWPHIVDLKGDIEPLLHKAIAAIRSRLSTPAPSARPRAVVDAAVANVRSGPSTASPVIFVLSRNQEVTPLKRRGNWVLIRIGGEGGKQGWVYGYLLKGAAVPK